MAEKVVKATLSKGRSGWCVIFRHPVALAADQKQKLRVRRDSVHAMRPKPRH